MNRFLVLTLGGISILSCASALGQQPEPAKVEPMPAPFESFQDEKQFNAVRLGPGNTFSIVETPPDFRLSDFAISSNGALLVMGWASGRIEIWDTHTKHRVSRFKSPFGEPQHLQFHAANQQLAITGSGGKVAFVEVPSGKKLREFSIPLGERRYDIHELAFDPQGKWMAYADEESSKVLNLSTSTPSQLADLKDAGSLALSLDGATLFTVNRNELWAFNTANWEVIGHWPHKSPPINTASVLVRAGVTKDGKGVVAVPSANGLVIYREPEMSGEFATDKPTSAVGFARSGQVFVNLSDYISLLTADGGVLCRRFYKGRRDYAISEDGQWLALWQDNSINLWRIGDLLEQCKARP